MGETQKGNARQSIMSVIAAGLTIICTIIGTTWKVSSYLEGKFESQNEKFTRQFTDEVIKPVTSLQTQMGVLIASLEEQKSHIAKVNEQFRFYDTWIKEYDAKVDRLNYQMEQHLKKSKP
jgi:hypothetical protein